jgi:hypothetical protein
MEILRVWDCSMSLCRQNQKADKYYCIFFRVKSKDLRFIKEMKCQIIEAVEKRKTSEETLL